MKLLFLVAAMATVATVVKGQANNYNFNCNLEAPGAECSGVAAGTCNQDGTCTCLLPAEGMNCDKVAGNRGIGDCATVVCENGGTCYDNNGPDGTAQCECVAGFAGATCNELRVDFTCSDDGGNPAVQTGITFNIYPYAYIDKIYTKGISTDAACQTSAGGSPGLQTLDVGHTACGNADDLGAGAFKRCFIVTNAANIVMPGFDYEICATCPKTGDTVTATATLTITGVDANINTVDLGGAADGDATMVVSQGGTNVPNRGPVEFGSDLTVTYTLVQPGLDKGFQSIFVDSCNVQNGANGTAPMDILTAGCPADRTRVWIGLTSGLTSAIERTLSFKAFVLQEGPAELMITCVIRFCKLEGDCAMADCGADGQGAGRKKRQVTAGETEEKTLARVVRVVDPYDKPSQVQTGEKEEKACYMSWQMTATIVALSVGLLLVLLLCVILVVKAILSRRGNQTVYRDGSVTTSTASLTHLPTIVSNKC